MSRGPSGYLDQMAGSPALRGTRRLCENEAANAVLTAKAEAMEREGIAADFAVSLPAGAAGGGRGPVRPAGQRPGQRHRGQPGRGGAAESPSAARRTRAFSCCGWRTPMGGAVQAGSCHHQGGQGRPRLRHPRDAGDRGALRRHPGRRGPGRAEFELVVCLPLAGGPKRREPPCAADTGENPIFHICRLCTAKKGDRPSDGLPFCVKSGLRASSKVRSAPRRGR